MQKLLLLLLLFSLQSGLNAQTYWQQKVDYVIDVTLNDVDHTLDGFEKITYTNNSPDTLHFIWFHVWPNAYKNDKTAFSEQMLLNNRTDFYFSEREQRGYINQLDFKVNGTTAQTTDHPQYIDVIKIVLPQPLAPGGNALISTPFHVQLPENFSRGGHKGDAYQVTQWYPKPAVYDRTGWHPMPYLDQGEFYSEIGNYQVQVTVPKNYVVASSGELQNPEEKEWLLSRANFNWEPTVSKVVTKKGSSRIVKKIVQAFPASAKETKTILFKQNNIHDFAWFADKRFVVKHDTLQLSSAKTIDVYSYYLPSDGKIWQSSVDLIKKALRFRSTRIGEYPYPLVSIAEAPLGFPGGMEYPCITSITPVSSTNELESVIEHEVGHNWFQGMLATDERTYPWMDEGFNSYYDLRYEKEFPHRPIKKSGDFISSRVPDHIEGIALQSLYTLKKDQPINTPSENMTETNYNFVTYAKTGQWMQLLEQRLGTAVFDKCMQEYFSRWQYKHPYPEDFKKVIAEVSGTNVDDLFSLLDKKGSLTSNATKKQVKPVAFFNLNHTDKYQYINILPGLGYNNYDKLMIGLVAHNYSLPVAAFRYVIAPLYATGSKTLNGIGRISYSHYTDSKIDNIEYSLSGERFSSKSSVDTLGNKLFESFYKIVPGIRVSFKHPALSHIKSNIDLRVFLVGEKKFDKYVTKDGDPENVYPSRFINGTRYITQLSYNVDNSRILYPYEYELQFQQGKDFYRFNLNGNYFFNYAKGGGMNVRAFGALFGYIGSDKTNAFIYQPKLLGVRGEEDYTYSNYFLGRSASISNPDGPIANKGLASQQIMIRDGGFKLILDQYEFLQGRSEQWVAALNFTTTLPNSIFPQNFPVKLFLDIGSYAEAWKNNPPTSKFLYTAGLQLSVLKNLLNVYMPVLYSSDFKDYIKSTWPKNRLIKSISFSIDIQHFNLGKIDKRFDW